MKPNTRRTPQYLDLTATLAIDDTKQRQEDRALLATAAAFTAALGYFIATLCGL